MNMGTCFALSLLQGQQFPNFPKRESQLLCAPDESNPSNILRAEQTKAPFGAWRSPEKPLLFVEPDGVDAQAGLLGYFSNPNPMPGHMPSEYTLKSTPESRAIPMRWNPVSENVRVPSGNCFFLSPDQTFEPHWRHNVKINTPASRASLFSCQPIC